MLTLQFSTTNGAGSRLIRFFTWSDFSHVDLVLANQDLLGARMSGGVRIRKGTERTFSKVAQFGVHVPATIEEQVIAFLFGQIGKPYDWGAIFGLVFRRNWQKTDSWFCSELIAAAFQQAGFPLLRETLNRITPRDLVMSPLLLPLDVTAELMKDQARA